MNPTRLLPLLGLCIPLAACNGDQRGAARGSTPGAFAIGAGASAGKPGYEGVMRGLALAVERLNSGAPSGLQFVVRVPSAAVGASAVQIAQELRDDPAVIAVVGHPESGTTMEAIPVYADTEHENRDGVAVVSPTASSPRLTGISPWFFRLAPSDNQAARLVAQYVADSVRATTVAVVYRNDAYGRDWTARFAEAFSDRRGTVLARLPYLSGMTEFTAYALQLRKLAPEVLLFPGDADDAMAMLRALQANDVHLTFIGGDGTAGIAATQEFPEARYTAFFQAERASTVEGKRFVESYRARFNETPDMFAALSYDAALVIGRTVAAGARTRRALREALEHVTGASAIDGASGRIAFNPQHDVADRSIVIARVGKNPR